MKKALFLLKALMITSALPIAAAETTLAANSQEKQVTTQRIGSINFKKVIDESKYGKQEQANFESLKKQMEAVLEGKEKVLNEMAEKLGNSDYLDSLSEDAEEEFKDKFRTLSQEFAQIQSQYYQSLNQTNMKILQQLQDIVAKAAEQVAKENSYDIILSDESGFYFSKSDVSEKIISVMDEMYNKENPGK